MTLVIMFVLGLIAGSSIVLLALFIWGAMDDIERLREIADGHPGGRTAWLLEVAVSKLETTAEKSSAVGRLNTTGELP